MRTLIKTGTYWVCHISVAAMLAYILTGDLRAAAAIGLLEPTVQAFVFYVHEWLWEAPGRRPEGAERAAKLAAGRT
jgi:uncharacterized membrane protein